MSVRGDLSYSALLAARKDKSQNLFQTLYRTPTELTLPTATKVATLRVCLNTQRNWSNLVQYALLHSMIRPIHSCTLGYQSCD